MQGKGGKHRGFSLLEVLITLAVLSVGLLGLALMQASGLHFTKSSYWRTQAMLLAGDIADRVRANDQNATSYVTSVTPIATTAPTCIAGAVCSGTQMAVSDLADWSNRIYEEFPGGSGQILAAGGNTVCPGQALTTIASGFMRVLISWQEVVGAGPSLQQNLSAGEEAGDCYQFDFVF